MAEAVVRPELLHLDSASAGRSSPEVLAAIVAHLHREREEGAYRAAELAEPSIARARAALARLLGARADEVAFTESATAGLRLLLAGWSLPPRARVGVLPAVWGPHLALLEQAGHDVELLDVDAAGVLDLEALERRLGTDPAHVLLLDQVASHRGLVQPVADAVRVAHAHGVPVWVDAAQAVGQVDVATGADAVLLTGRKWLAGPRGVGALLVSREAEGHLTTPREQLESREAFVAGRLGFGRALEELDGRGPAATYAALAAVGAQVRAAVEDLPGWEVVHPEAPAGSITVLAPTAGQDVEAERERLLGLRILTSPVQSWRAPRDPLLRPGLRIAGHVDTTAADLQRLLDALSPSPRTPR